jgi:hypothetical protein
MIGFLPTRTRFARSISALTLEIELLDLGCTLLAEGVAFSTFSPDPIRIPIHLEPGTTCLDSVSSRLRLVTQPNIEII